MGGEGKKPWGTGVQVRTAVEGVIKHRILGKYKPVSLELGSAPVVAVTAVVVDMFTL